MISVMVKNGEYDNRDVVIDAECDRDGAMRCGDNGG